MVKILEKRGYISSLIRESLPQSKYPTFPLHPEEVPPYESIEWDVMSQAKREDIALIQAKNAAIFAKKYVPFYKEHLKRYEIKDLENITSLEEFSQLPQTTKEHLSKNSSIAFIPEGVNLIGMKNYGTGGTTGKPVTIWLSGNDWNAMACHIARSIKYDFRENPNYLKGKKIFGLYHGNHITNHIYKSGLKLLGMHVIDRVSTKQDVMQNYEFMQEIKPDGMLAPPEDYFNKQTKGITLDELLKLDAKNNKKDTNLKMVLWSSMPLGKDLYNYLTEYLGVEYVQGQYGSTECCPTGATCQYNPFSFHLGYGPTLVNVVKDNKLVNEGQQGYVLVSKTGAMFCNGTKVVPTGTSLINFRTGDYAELRNTKSQSCECGRTTPILYNLNRKENNNIKAKFGCQTD